MNSGKGCNSKCNNLEDFLYNVSFYTTWIGGFSLWKEDREGIRNNLYACDKYLWQVPIIINAVIKHNKGLVIREKLFSINADMSKRVGAYNNSLYTIFYDNYFSLLDEIFDKYPISNKCYKWLKKDLLFHFFSNWLVLYTLYSPKPREKPSLMQLVYNAYKKESYLLIFYCYYFIKLLYKIMKTFMKR